MEAALKAARAKGTNERLAGVERLHEALDAAARRGLTAAEVTSLVDTCMDLTGDGNFRVAQGGLQALSAAAVLAGDHFKVHLNELVPAAVERLGDGKQPVRDAARQLLVTLMEVSSPTIIVERAGNYAWTHKSWKVREEFARTVAAAVGLFASTELPLQRVLLAPILQLMSDLNHSVRDAAISCIEEMYRNIGSQFHEELQRHNLPSYMLKEINSRLSKIEPNVPSSGGSTMQPRTKDSRSISASPKRGSPRKKSSQRENTLFGGKFYFLAFHSFCDTDINEKPVEPIKVHSEKELVREFEKIASSLNPEKDWSIRIAAMQRIEALVYGGAIDYPSFLMLLKQLVRPLSSQLSDRRSSIVKQACHLLNVLSKELLGDFEACAEIFIPVLFRLVVITVLVIAESADICIKTILRNCKVSRILPLIADTAKNDRGAVLRARCCEYALLILEYWADVPEIQRSADLYEDLIKCCVADAMSEIINDEDGGMHKRHPSPSLNERGVQLYRASSHEGVSHFGYGTSPIVAMDKNAAISSEPSHLSSNLLLSGNRPERSIESVLSSSKQKVSAIESLLNGGSMSDRNTFSAVHSTNLNHGVDHPSSRGPPSLRAAPALDLVVTKERSRSSGRSQDGSTMDDNNDAWPGRSPKMQMDRHYTGMPYRDVNYRNSLNHHVPHFQRPLRKQVVSRASASARHSFDGGHVLSSDMPGYTDRQKGIQEITQSFEKVMKLYFCYLDDPHHKVAQAAFSTLTDIIPAFKKPLESYIERILPYVFPRLIDPKELVRQPCSLTLEIVGRTYSIDTLLPALVRSLDEQRSPKAKLAVLEFANKSFNNYTVDSEGYTNRAFLKLWLSKLAPLVHEKNSKLKEASVSGIISVYSYFDSAAVLNFILSLSIEEQNIVRRALKKHTPRVEFDLVNYLQSKKERPRPKSYDNVDSRASSEDGYALTLKKSFPLERFSASMLDTEGGKKMNTVEEPTLLNVPIGQTASDLCIDHAKQCLEHASEAELFTSSKELKNDGCSVVEAVHSWTDYPERSDATIDDDNSTGTPHLDFGHRPSDGHDSVVASAGENTQEGDPFVDISSVKIIPHASNGSSIPQLLHQISNNGEVSSLVKREALQQLVRASTNNDKSIWTKILTAVLEVLDDSDSSVREISLLLVAEMLHNQKDPVEESIDIVLEKLLHLTKDDVAKVSNEAYKCLNVALEKYDPFRCLAVIVPLLVSDEEKTLFMCINCLTKLVGRLSQEELLTQVPSFLPSLFDAFSNQSPDVRKVLTILLMNAVVFCLVDIYIMLGKAFVPYLEGLNSTQLRLVTIYANRISQARCGTPVDANQ
ncbi:hypothetical protein EJB05_20770 [Eragrostis curvula]|uniref:TOG domain-containing protein n=1 Tax=Eragrostis curvula TaxID=38414 RepID=A0A5J9UZ58_9POAL|nr:hypothetical protein EJB05_20770 [Eragrostis curvula]